MDLRYPSNWNEIAKSLKDREQWRCYRCGIQCRQGKFQNPSDRALLLQVHHWDFNPENNSLENLVCLCTGCHLSLHRRLQGSITPGQVSLLNTEAFRAIPPKAAPIPIRITQLKIPVVTIQLGLLPVPEKIVRLQQYKTQLSLPLAI